MTTEALPVSTAITTRTAAGGPSVGMVCKRRDGPTGQARYARALSRALEGLGVPVTVVETGRGSRRRRPFGPDPASFFATYPWRLPALPGVDVVHLTSQNLASALVLGRRPRTVVAVTIHDVIPYLERRWGGGARPWYENLLDRAALAGLRRAEILLADSEHTRRAASHAARIDPERIAVVPLAVDHDCFYPTPVRPPAGRYGLPGEPVVLYVGSTERRKNLPTLLQAFAVVRAFLPGACLALAGPDPGGPESGALRRLAQELGIGRTVFWLGTVPEEELPELYRMADVFVYPSRLEGFGLTPLEAMACGTPVVAADAGSLTEVVGDGGLLVDPDDPRALARAVVALLTDEELRRSRVGAGLARAACFTWEATARATLEALSAGLAAQGRPLRSLGRGEGVAVRGPDPSGLGGAA